MNASTDVAAYIRKLAKTDYWQSLFSLSKEIKIKLFTNETDITNIQLLFLKYLNFYWALNTDVALGDVSEIVLEDVMYEDAYMMYKNKSDKKKLKESTQQHQQNNHPPAVIPTTKTSTWVFKKKNSN